MILDNIGCYLKSFQVECVCKLHPAQRYGTYGTEDTRKKQKTHMTFMWQSRGDVQVFVICRRIRKEDELFDVQCQRIWR